MCKSISAIDSVYNRTMALECEFKGLSDQAVPKQLKEYLKSLGFEGPRYKEIQKELSTMCWTAQYMDCPGDKPAHWRVERFHATLEELMRTWRNGVAKRYGVSSPAHHPTVAWLVRHSAWLDDRFVMKRQNQQTPFQRQMIRDHPGVVISIFETVLWREPGPNVLKFKEKWGVGIWAGRDNLADVHIILTRQGALTARSVRRLAPSKAADQQHLLAAKGHPGRLKALADEPEVLPSPPAKSF